MLDLALDGRIFLDNPMDCALQEIDMLLNTENTQLIGYPNYGTEFESFLWTLSPTTIEIEKYKDKIEEFRMLFDLDILNYPDEILLEALKNHDFDYEQAFSDLFE